MLEYVPGRQVIEHMSSYVLKHLHVFRHMPDKHGLEHAVLMT